MGHRARRTHRDREGRRSNRPTGPRHVAPASEAPGRGRRWIGDAICGALLVALCLGVGLSRYRNGIDTRDEGFLAYGAARVLGGEMPNRDFVSLQPPLSFYTSAGAYVVLGTSLVSLRTLGLALYTLIPILVYATARQRTRYVASMAAAVPAAILGLPFFNFVPFAVWHGVAAALAAACLTIRAATTGHASTAILAGVATALTVLSRHDQGAYLTVAVVAYGVLLVLTDERDVVARVTRLLAYWAIGAAVPLALLAAWWLAAGAIPLMFHQLVVFPLTTYAKTSSLPMPRFHRGLSFTDGVVVAMYYVPPVVDAIAAVWLAVVFVGRRARLRDAHAAFLVILAGLFYCQVLTRSDLQHLVITLGPWFVVLAWCAAGLTERLSAAVEGGVSAGPARRAGAIAVRATPLAVGASLLVALTPVMIPADDHPLAVLDLPRGGVRIDARAAQTLQSIVGVVQHFAPPDRAILSLPYSPMFYFLADRRNPTRWNYLWPGDETASDYQAMLAEVRKDPPAAITLTEEDAMQGYAPALLDYVRADFKMAVNFGMLRVYVPSSVPIR